MAENKAYENDEIHVTSFSDENKAPSSPTISSDVERSSTTSEIPAAYAGRLFDETTWLVCSENLKLKKKTTSKMRNQNVFVRAQKKAICYLIKRFLNTRWSCECRSWLLNLSSPIKILVSTNIVISMPDTKQNYPCSSKRQKEKYNSR